MTIIKLTPGEAAIIFNKGGVKAVLPDLEEDGDVPDHFLLAAALSWAVTEDDVTPELAAIISKFVDLAVEEEDEEENEGTN